jgi:hypothetical protein
MTYMTYMTYMTHMTHMTHMTDRPIRRLLPQAASLHRLQIFRDF